MIPANISCIINYEQLLLRCEQHTTILSNCSCFLVMRFLGITNALLRLQLKVQAVNYYYVALLQLVCVSLISN